MLSSEQAIRSAVDYFKSLPTELLGAPKDIRLESIDRSNGEWLVVLSYAADTEEMHTPISDSPLAHALRAVRRYKELDVDVETGDVLRMTKPKAVS